MLKAYALRLHRWLALIAALPLMVIIVTGLVLTFEPLAQNKTLDTPLTRETVLGYLDRYDPEGKARGLTLRAYENALEISGVGPDGAIEIDLRTGQEVADSEDWALSDVFYTARRLHETLMLDAGWLVSASTIAMLVIGLFGLLMGWPRLRNTLGGWHATSAWIILPLTVLVPLTGLALAFGISFQQPSGPRPEPVIIREAVVLLADKVDLSGLTSLRQRGTRLLARVYVGHELTSFGISKSGVVTVPANWPRAIHEGNWHAIWGTALNSVASVVFLGLWGTGLVIWARRKFRKRLRVRAG